MSTVRDFRTGEEVDPIEAAYRRIRREYDDAKEQAKRYGGPCKSCRHFTTDGGTLSEDYCHNPLVATFQFERSSGQVVAKHHLILSWMASKNHGLGVPDLCGADRRLWEPKLTIWERVWKWFTRPFTTKDPS